MRRFWLAACGAALLALATGCSDATTTRGKAESEKAASKTGKTGEPGAQGSGNPLTAPVDYLGAVGAAQKRSALTVDQISLQQAVQAFQAGEERLPRTLQELVSEGYLPRLPAAPKGMRWAYQPQTGQVRAVAAEVAAPAPR